VKRTISKENYLKAIAEAQSEGETVIAATLARWVHVSPPAVTMAIRRLSRDGLIRATEAKGEIQLTAAGRKIAHEILHRHHLIERMLSEVFGMEWFKVHDEAERLEHAVSADFEALLAAKLGPQRACPHGSMSEIDSPRERRLRGLQTLNEVASPALVQVVSVYERDRATLERLDALRVRPGVEIAVDGGFRIKGEKVKIPAPLAERVWVEKL
jgi:DtxR family transcriptional regulator, Mn-dependent transcriptional regulator